MRSIANFVNPNAPRPGPIGALAHLTVGARDPALMSKGELGTRDYIAPAAFGPVAIATENQPGLGQAMATGREVPSDRALSSETHGGFLNLRRALLLVLAGILAMVDGPTAVRGATDDPLTVRSVFLVNPEGGSAGRVVGDGAPESQSHNVVIAAVAAGNSHLHVSPSGSDSNPGTQTEPFRTIVKAASVVAPGDTVHVAPGTYAGYINATMSGRPSARIRYVSDTPWGAKIVPANNTYANGGTIFWNKGDYVDIEGFDVSANGNNVWATGIWNDGSHGRIYGNHVHHISATGSGGNGGAGIGSAGNYVAVNNDFFDNVVHDIGNLSSNQNLVHGIYHAHKGGKIYNNIIYRIQGCGIHLWHAPRDITISNNLVFKSNVCGIVVGAGDSPGGVTADNVVVTNNLIVDNAWAIYESGKTGPNNVYRNNMLWNNNNNFISLRTGRESNTSTANPQLVDYKANGTGNYRPSAASPAIDNGTSLGAPAIDIDGISRRRGGGIDIGPYEYRGPPG